MRRWAALALAIAACLVGGPTAAAGAAPAPLHHPVVFIGMPDLRWSDLAAMPRLSALMARGAVGELSVRSEGEATRCGDAQLELSAGTRVPSGLTSCDIDAAQFVQLRERYRHSRYGARLGLLGDAVGRFAAPGSSSTVVLSTSAGPEPRPLSVPVPALGFPRLSVMVIEGFYGAVDRRAARLAIDSGLASTLQNLPADAVVIVAGISDGPTGGPHLHPIVVAGPSWPHRELTSASTGRAPYVQLFDLTATMLASQGITDPPRGVSGRAIRASSDPVRSVATYVDIDRHARRALHVGHPTFTALCVGLLVVLLLVLVRPGAAVWPARLLVFAPVATWLVQLLPWWRSSLLVYACFIVGVAGVGAVATWLVGRVHARFALLLGPVVTAVVLVADQLLGAPLQMAAPLGDNPLVAGRFHGMGNIDFGGAMAAVLFCLAVLAAGRDRARALAIVAVGGVVALIIDGAPSLGDDIGGVLALVPAIALLAAVVARVRLTVRRVVAVGVAAVITAAAVALADYARPEEKRTHAGRFVEELRDGTAWQTVHRKLDAVLASFANPVVTAAVLLALVGAVMYVRRSGGPTAATSVRAAAGPVAVLALIGTVLNDSGIFVAAAALLAVVPAAVAAGLGPPALGDTRTL